MNATNLDSDKVIANIILFKRHVSPWYGHQYTVFSFTLFSSTTTNWLLCQLATATNRYSPLKQSENNPGPLKYQPVRCKRSGSILNPHCVVDYHSKSWTCPFTGARNQFPAHYASHITEQNLPAELLPQFTTVEYEIPGRDFGPPVFLFVVDTCCRDKDELDELKDSLQQVFAIPSLLSCSQSTLYVKPDVALTVGKTQVPLLIHLCRVSLCCPKKLLSDSSHTAKW